MNIDFRNEKSEKIEVDSIICNNRLGKTMLGITKKEKSTYITKTHFSKEIKVIYD